jgi:hypothetical protein
MSVEIVFLMDFKLRFKGKTSVIARDGQIDTD